MNIKNVKDKFDDIDASVPVDVPFSSGSVCGFSQRFVDGLTNIFGGDLV